MEKSRGKKKMLLHLSNNQRNNLKSLLSNLMLTSRGIWGRKMPPIESSGRGKGGAEAEEEDVEEANTIRIIGEIIWGLLL